jgi:hypothetical protein
VASNRHLVATTCKSLSEISLYRRERMRRALVGLGVANEPDKLIKRVDVRFPIASLARFANDAFPLVEWGLSPAKPFDQATEHLGGTAQRAGSTPALAFDADVGGRGRRSMNNRV